MVYLLSYQIFKYEHGLTTAEQRAADVRAGEGAAAVRDLRHRLGRTLRPPAAPGLARGARGGDDRVRFTSSVR